MTRAPRCLFRPLCLCIVAVLSTILAPHLCMPDGQDGATRMAHGPPPKTQGRAPIIALAHRLGSPLLHLASPLLHLASPRIAHGCSGSKHTCAQGRESSHACLPAPADDVALADGRAALRLTNCILAGITRISATHLSPFARAHTCTHINTLLLVRAELEMWLVPT